MTTLRLGVLDVPYTGPGKAASKSTGDVAEILEAKYHIMELFFEENATEIVSSLEQSIGDALSDLLGGAPIGNNALTAATEDIRLLFNRFLDTKALDGLSPNVPTAAAQRGVNHRFKHPYAKANPARPSFIDTGLYEASFRAEIVS